MKVRLFEWTVSVTNVFGETDNKLKRELMDKALSA